MKYTFNLKEPKSAKETLILFSCYFKHENKKFVFSTGEHIVPEFWDFDSRSPIERGKNKSLFAQSIKMQLNRYSTLFLETESLYKRVGEDFTSKILKKVFAEEFKRIPSGKNIFFDSYDEFTNEKIKSKEWSISTIKRYQNIKNILKNFEKSKNFNLTFSKIDDEFHREFTSY
ncbi:phage integrase SAM-like domain-containing protein, partial [Flavobacterium psychrophilum]|nr:phage integrase SAM-like domain-containing protein [Flavobacterium psychrophilum]